MAENLEFRISGNTNDAVVALEKLQKEAIQTGNVVGTSLSKSVNSAQQSLSKLPKSSNQATNALINLGRVAQDAPFGIIGIANNLNPLLESFQRTAKEAGGFTNTLKALGSALLGGGGIGLALSLVTSGLTFFALRKRKAKEETEALKKETELAAQKQREFESALSSASSQVVKQAADLSDLKNILISITEATNTLTQATINKGVAQFLFDQKNLKVQELLSAEIEQQIKLRKQQRPFAEVGEFRPGSFSKDPLTKRIADLKGEVRGINDLAFGLDDLFKQIFNKTFKSGGTIDKAIPPNKLGEGLLKSLSIPAEKLNNNLSASLSAVLERTATTADFGEAARIVNLQLFNALDKEFKALGAEIPDIDLNVSPVINAENLGAALSKAKELVAIGEQIGQAFGNAFSEIGTAIIKGQDAFQAFGQAVNQILIQIISKLIEAAVTALILSAITGGKFGANFLKQLGFGGNRAEGGTVNEGQAYRVGERGPEWFVPQVSGSIIPTSQKTALPRMSGKSTSFSTQRFKIRGKDILLSSSRTGASQSRLGVA